MKGGTPIVITIHHHEDAARAIASGYGATRNIFAPTIRDVLLALVNELEHVSPAKQGAALTGLLKANAAHAQVRAAKLAEEEREDARRAALDRYDAIVREKLDAQRRAMDERRARVGEEAARAVDERNAR
jgi:hypothetical protein